MSTETTTTRAPVVRPGTAARAGMALPVVFLTVMVLLTWAEYDAMRGLGWRAWEGYTADVHYPSVLARGPYGWVQSVNFLVAGALALALLSGLRGQLRPGAARRTAVIGLGMFGFAGLLNAVPTNLPGESGAITVAGLVHFIGFVMTMLGGMVGTTAAGLALRGRPGWSGWWVYSALTGPAVLVMLTGVIPLPENIGFYLVLVVLFGWFGVIGARLARVVSPS